MKSKLLLPSVVIALSSVVSQAAVLIDGTLADGDRSDLNLPSETSVWLSHSGSSVIGANSLLYTQSGSSQKMWMYFTPNGAPISLAVGDQLIASAKFLPRTALYDNDSRSFRFGLFYDPTDPQVLADLNDDGGGGSDPWTDSTGYGVQLALSTGASASANANVGKRTDQLNASLMGSGGAWTLNSGGAAIVNTLDTEYTISLALNRTAVDQVVVTFTISDANGVVSTHSVTDDPNGAGVLGTGPIATQFDHFFFRFSNNTSTADALEFTEFRVEYLPIPEPSSFALAGLGLLGVLFARRLRR